MRASNSDILSPNPDQCAGRDGRSKGAHGAGRQGSGCKRPLRAGQRADLEASFGALDLSVRANDIERRVGKDHIAAVKVRTQMKEVREAIAEEQQRISGSFSKDYELARARYDEISATMTRLMGEEGANSDTQAKMRELESAADAFAASTTGRCSSSAR